MFDYTYVISVFYLRFDLNIYGNGLYITNSNQFF